MGVILIALCNEPDCLPCSTFSSAAFGPGGATAVFSTIHYKTEMRTVEIVVYMNI